MKAKVKIKTAKLKEDQWGHHIEITKVGLYDLDGKWIKWLPLTERVISLLTRVEINIEYPENQ
jgi:hypothetical protein